MLVVAILPSFAAIVPSSMGLLRHIRSQFFTSIRWHVHAHTTRLSVAIDGTHCQYLRPRLSTVRRIVGGIGGDFSENCMGAVTVGMGGDQNMHGRKKEFHRMFATASRTRIGQRSSVGRREHGTDADRLVGYGWRRTLETLASFCERVVFYFVVDRYVQFKRHTNFERIVCMGYRFLWHRHHCCGPSRGVMIESTRPHF